MVDRDGDSAEDLRDAMVGARKAEKERIWERCCYPQRKLSGLLRGSGADSGGALPMTTSAHPVLEKTCLDGW
jgi:hypothetical protein